jgi:hypothetical protein
MFRHCRPASLFSALVLCLGALASQAHEVWIEDTPTGELVVRFGEYGDSFEKSPGSLDMMTLPAAWAPAADGKTTSFDVQKKADHFALPGSSASQIAQAETGFAVMGKPGNPEKPARKPYFYARWQAAGAGAAEPALIFDLVPTATAGEVRVYFRGKPLAAVKAKLVAPDGAEQELVSDDAGLIHFTAPKPGFYLLYAQHQRENTPGFAGGKPFDQVSHNCSLTWRVGAASK